MSPETRRAVVRARRGPAWLLLVAAVSCENSHWPKNEPPRQSAGGGVPCTGTCEGEQEQAPDPYAAYAPGEARSLAAAAANGVLATHCGSCHGAEAVESESVEAAFDDVYRIESLVDGPWISRCRSERSPLVGILGGAEWASYHHETVLTPPAPGEQVSIVADFIDRDCQRLAVVCEEDPSLVGCDMVRVETWLEQACGECHGGKLDSGFRDGLTCIEDLPSQIKEGRVIPCRSEESLLVRYMQIGATQQARRPA